MNKSKSKKWLNRLIFLLGLLILAYPFVAQQIHQKAAQTQVQEFMDRSSLLTPPQMDHRIELAKAYNSTILPSMNGILDPFTQVQKEGIKEYARMLKINEQIGVIEIPKIDVKLPIHAGATEEVLQKSAAHLQGTSLPVGGPNTNSVITAHRGLPSAKLFTDLDQLEMGDLFYIQNLRDRLVYEIVEIKVIEPSEYEALRIVEGEDRATLLTCTPYMINSHRLLVIGKRTQEKKANQPVVKANRFPWKKFYFWLIISLIFLVGGLLFYLIKRRKKPKHSSR